MATSSSSPYAALPQPVRLEDTRTSLDAASHPEELPEGLVEVEWQLRTSAG